MAGRRRFGLRRGALLRTGVPIGLALAAIVSLIVAANPGQFGESVKDFHLEYVPFILVLSIGYYVLQGVRWWTLLRVIKAPVALGETVLICMAGQATALLPLGELTRAVLLTRIRKVPFGSAVATVTVQELLYSAILIAVALPGAQRFEFARIGVGAALAGTVAVIALLTVRPFFRPVRRLVQRLPILRRLTPQIDELQRDTVVLLERGRTYAWLPISALQALMAVSLFWLVVNGLDPGSLDWRTAAMVYSISNVASAITLSPGGLGAFEASTAGLLYGVGLPFHVATAAAVVQRVADKGLSAVIGMGLFAHVRGRHHLTDVSLAEMRPPPQAVAGG